MNRMRAPLVEFLSYFLYAIRVIFQGLTARTLAISTRYFWRSEVAFVSDINSAVLVVTGWISHIDKSLQKKTNDLTNLHCLLNKRGEIAENRSHPTLQRLINSEGINYN